MISVLAIFVVCASLTGSKLNKFNVPGPFIGEFSFTYTTGKENSPINGPGT